jgi:RES domain-containing protein
MEARQMHSSHVVIGVDIPDDVPGEEVATNILPKNWESHPAPTELQASGRDWVERRQTAILKVPSAVVPYEYNYILNPAHPDFRRLQIRSPQRFRFDTRLWKMG